MSNFTRPARPPGVPPCFAIGAEDVNGTGQTFIWIHDENCRTAGGDRECCTGELLCQPVYMSWREMAALAQWMIGEAQVAEYEASRRW